MVGSRSRRYRHRVEVNLDAWDAWHPTALAHRMAGLTVPWYVAAGWALDLFRGCQTRDHEDLEIAVPADRFTEVAERFPDCEFFVPGGGVMVPFDAETQAGHQTWAWETATGKWRFDVFREPHDGDTWICRRDERIRLPYPKIISRDAAGIPYLVPELVLLFKAKGDRAKDRADLAGVLPLLDAVRRRWLADALEMVHPGHPWLMEV